MDDEKIYIVMSEVYEDEYGIDVRIMGVYEDKEEADKRNNEVCEKYGNSDVMEFCKNKKSNVCVGFYCE